MKNYIKPSFNCIQLCAEEGIANLGSFNITPQIMPSNPVKIFDFDISFHILGWVLSLFTFRKGGRK